MVTLEATAPSGGVAEVIMGVFRRRRDDATLDHGIAHLRGIRILASTEDSPERQRLRLEIDGPEPVVGGVELTDAPRWLRFGQQLPVTRERRGLRVDWDRARPAGPHPSSEGLVKPPDPGIDDGTSKAAKARRRGQPCRVEIEETSDATLLGLGTGKLDLRTVVRPEGGEAYALDIGRQAVPFYAAHLLRPGTTVPGWVRSSRPDKVVIDWPMAATEEPGIGVDEEESDDAVRADSVLGSGIDSDPSMPTAEGSADAVDGVDFDTWVSIEAGLVRDRVAPADHDGYASERGAPAGRWSTVSETWHGRVRTDWRLGARFGAAYEEAMRSR